MRVFTGYDFEYLAEEKGFLVIYPQGYKNHWNDCRGTADYEANELDIDDVGYFKQVVKFLKTDFRIDTNRIVVSGMSNGGHMVFKLAYEIPEDILNAWREIGEKGIQLEAKWAKTLVAVTKSTHPNYSLGSAQSLFSIRNFFCCNKSFFLFLNFLIGTQK